MERKLAAILIADVAGYSRLSHRDEEGTRSRFLAHLKDVVQPKITEHGGRLVKTMGDGLLVEFPSIVNALRCAIDIQQAESKRNAELPGEQQLWFRIGINLGDVIAEGDDVHGDGVNIADRLQGLADPGGIVISGSAYDYVKNKLEVDLESLGEQRLKNIDDLVRAYRIRLEGVPAARRRASLLARRWAVTAAAGIAAVVITASVGLLWHTWEPNPEPASPAKTALPLPDRPSIAVLPFNNQSGDQRLGRLADGMVDEIITDLSRFRELFVIARTSTFIYREKPTDVRQIGHDLGVRYVLEGRVQSGGKGLRVSSQLVDTTTGALVWSQDYNGSLDDLFTVQADIASRIAGSIGGAPGALRQAVLDVARRRSSQNLEAYDFFLLGNEARLRLKQEDHPKAMELLHRAVALEPSFQPAHAALALAHWIEVDYNWAPFQAAMDAWLNEAQQAVALDPGDAMAHVALGLRYGYANEFDRNAAEFDAALRANYNDPDALSLIGGQLPWLEPPGRAVELVERAQRLNPFASKISHMAKLAYYFAGQFEKAIAQCKAHGDLNFFDYQFLAMSYGELGKPAEAKANTAQVMHLKPQFSAEWALTYNGEFAPAAAVNRALFFDGVTKAGLPRCATAQQIAADPRIKRLAECDAKRSTSN
jgi:TolB-like protein/class 3 adenylate cyclase/tetratricopeptide (TPR) repeat protein